MMSVKVKYGETFRGFHLAEFMDKYGVDCSVQHSSTLGEIWVGVREVVPMIRANRIKPGETGWVRCPLPGDVQLNGRMLLTRNHVRELMVVLQRWLDRSDDGSFLERGFRP